METYRSAWLDLSDPPPLPLSSMGIFWLLEDFVGGKHMVEAPISRISKIRLFDGGWNPRGTSGSVV